MPIERIDHYSIRTTDVEASCAFYTQVMGFHVGARPPFKFPGAWLYVNPNDTQTNGIVHLVGVDPDNPDALTEYLDARAMESLSGSGAVDHIAFSATGVADMRARLRRLGIAFRERTVPSLGLHQLFVQDPSDVTLELNYPASEVDAS